MRKGLILLFLAACGAASAQPIPSKEAFLNEVYCHIVDSTASGFYLSRDAYPCGFIKYNYEEWFKYNLKEYVPIYILDELAEKCYRDRRHATWQQDSLAEAVCVSPLAGDSIKHPHFDLSKPEFTDDGRYAIIDVVIHCGRGCTSGYTCLFRRIGPAAWKIIGNLLNWAS
ncbi:MAG: hypothetical protein Q8943_05545 [Bacteroidota bacterium]|nr:hypothetical protein [Bacteroidota bacterium]